MSDKLLKIGIVLILIGSGLVLASMVGCDINGVENVNIQPPDLSSLLK